MVVEEEDPARPLLHSVASGTMLALQVCRTIQLHRGTGGIVAPRSSVRLGRRVPARPSGKIG
jgi:hypothetical protein